jgi:Leu/Phe-tRNA-protein transferase
MEKFFNQVTLLRHLETLRQLLRAAYCTYHLQSLAHDVYVFPRAQLIIVVYGVSKIHTRGF